MSENNDYLKIIPHLKLNIDVPTQEILQESDNIEHYYGLRLNDYIGEDTRTRYITTSLGNALRSYAPHENYPYYTPGSKAIWIDEKWLDQGYFRTPSWDAMPFTVDWLINNICSEENLGLVSLHKIVSGGWVDWHSHCIFKHLDNEMPYNKGIVHISIKTNDQDLSEVKNGDILTSVNYPLNEAWLFNGYLDHRSINNGNEERLHLVVECLFDDKIFQLLLEQSINE